jgi:hypothetical protein
MITWGTHQHRGPRSRELGRSEQPPWCRRLLGGTWNFWQGPIFCFYSQNDLRVCYTCMRESRTLWREAIRHTLEIGFHFFFLRVAWMGSLTCTCCWSSRKVGGRSWCSCRQRSSICSLGELEFKSSKGVARFEGLSHWESPGSVIRAPGL